jgi:hypothetical protein
VVRCIGKGDFGASILTAAFVPPCRNDSRVTAGMNGLFR